jgi:ketosteroid isomerase-like protein
MRPGGDPLRISAAHYRFVAPVPAMPAMSLLLPAAIALPSVTAGGRRPPGGAFVGRRQGMLRWDQRRHRAVSPSAPGEQGVEMPWFPEFASAAQLAREEVRDEGLADPVGEFLAALREGDPRILEAVWPGEIVIYDPQAGEIRGHKQVREFIRRNLSWLAGLHARAETVAATRSPGRAVVELLTRLDHDGRELAWPLAVVAESADDRSVVFRTYCSQWPVDELRHVRPPVLGPVHGPGQIRTGDVVDRYLTALAAGDAEAVAGTFAPDGYFRTPSGRRYAHGSGDELRSFFARCFAAGGGIALQPCAVTDNGVRCAVEYNCVRWGIHDLPPQAGLGVYQRGSDGLLTAARVYDDVQPPSELSGRGRSRQ